MSEGAVTNDTMSVNEKADSSKYPDWARMPKDYNFTTRGVDWGKYSKYYLLRTDAVYEKTK